MSTRCRAKEKRLKKDAYRRRWTDLDSSSSLDAQLVLYPDAAWLGAGPMSGGVLPGSGLAGGSSPGIGTTGAMSGAVGNGARPSFDMDDSLELELDRADDDDDELSLSDSESVSPTATAAPGSPSKSGLGPAAGSCAHPTDLVGMH